MQSPSHARMTLHELTELEELNAHKIPQGTTWKKESSRAGLRPSNIMCPGWICMYQLRTWTARA
eukprot:scaffold189045_cov37-Prasinocladus_malaysianus.AAC.1